MDSLLERKMTGDEHANVEKHGFGDQKSLPCLMGIVVIPPRKRGKIAFLTPKQLRQ
jgi:hypothetical protein